MRQLLQSLRTGQIELVDAPCPTVRPGHLLCRSRASLISAGTERMLLAFGRAGWLEKARQQPDKVRQVLDKLRSDGVWSTLESVRGKLDEPLPLGYCNVGSVIQLGQRTEGLHIGDRVVSNGHHAEVVCVPRNLCAKVPDSVSDEAAPFAVLGAVGLQGLRLAEPTLGETFVVTGLGLVGLLTVQLLRAHGCRVLGLDFNAQRLELAGRFGAETVNLARGDDPVAAAMEFSRGRGVDGVLLTAATKSNEPVRQAAHMCRKRGRIVLVGVTGLHLSRSDFYEKELLFRVSCSYGPGRYDPQYEQAGHDYPLSHARWTAQRNFEAVLDMLADGRLDVAPLLTHRFALTDAPAAYDLIAQQDSPALGLLLEYPRENQQTDEQLRRTCVWLTPAEIEPTTEAAAPVRSAIQSGTNRGDGPPGPRVAVIGAGAFACRTLIPALRKCAVMLDVVASRSGVSSLLAARRFQFTRATTDVERVFDDPQVDAVVIATPHDSHADLVCRALASGKHVYVEKPLAITPGQLDAVEDAMRRYGAGPGRPLLMIGFNRRFAPQVRQIAPLLHGSRVPKAMVMTVNAGALPADSPLHDPQVGGGRIVGEACHFIDLLRYLCGAPVVSVQAAAVAGAGAASKPADSLTITLGFADGSLGTIHYLANGHRRVAKERLDIFFGGRVIELDNFRRLRAFGCPSLKGKRLWRQDKGHAAAVSQFVEAIRTGRASPIPFLEMVEVTRVAFDTLSATESGETVHCRHGLGCSDGRLPVSRSITAAPLSRSAGPVSNGATSAVQLRRAA